MTADAFFEQLGRLGYTGLLDRTACAVELNNLLAVMTGMMVTGLAEREPGRVEAITYRIKQLLAQYPPPPQA